jgi:hypothetical protein
MPFWVKDSAYSWSPVKELWVKVASNGSGAWQLASEAWVKVSSTGSSAWKKFYTNTSLKPYSTVPISIRTSSYTGTNVSGSYTYVGTKLWGNESVSPTNYWQNGPFTSTSYNWYYSKTSDGSGLLDGYTNIDTFDSTYYDGYYIYFQVKKTNSRGLSGTETSSPAYICLHVPTHGTNTFGLTTTAAQVGTPITFAYSWKNSSSYGIDTSRSTIEWYRGYPYADKRNLIESKTYSQLVATSYGSDYYGTYSYTPITADLNNNIYVVSTAYNSYTDYTSSPIVDTYSSDVIYTKPIINNPVTINKDGGYQTYGYNLSANTQTYTPTSDLVYWGWQYASTNTATTGRTFYHYISPPGIQVNDFGSDSYEGGTHTFTLRDVYDNATGNTVSLVGQYLRFYSIGQKGGAQSDVNYSSWIGPIYNAPVAPTTGPSISFAGAYSASYAYIRAFWDPVTYTKDYTLQYKSGSSWVDLVTLTTAPQYASTDSFLVPVGSQIFRVRTRNDDGINLYSPEVTYVVTGTYNFAFGNYLYPNTNGQIGLDGGVQTVYPSSGRAIGVYPLDMAETTTGYYSDSRYFYIQFSGYQYQNVGTATYALRYQVKFDTLNPTYADVLICNKGSSLPLTVTQPGLYNGSNAVSGLPGPYVISTGTKYRIYMDGTIGSFGQTQAQIPSSNFITDSLAYGTADDGYHSIATSANQYQKNMLSVTSATVDSSGVHVSFTGLNDYSYYNYTLNTGSYSGSVWNSLNSQTANPLNIGSLTGGTTYYLTITPYNSLGQAGNVYQNSFTAPNNPQPFTTTSGSKGFPSGATQSVSEPSGNRTVTVGWNSSTNSAVYEVALQGSTDNSTWSYVTIGGVSQTLDNSAYVLSGTSKTFTAPYYRYYRYTVRGRGSDYSLSNAVYSDYGTSTSLVWKNVDGTAPSSVSLGTITKTTTTASIPFTIPSGGSNTVDWIQYSTDLVSWTNTYTSPLSLSSLSANTSYNYYIRALNWDQIAGSYSTASFTTDQIAVPTNSSVPTLSGTTKVGQTLTFGVGSWTGSPTSYSLRLYRGTAGVATSETLVKDAGNTTSSTYAIPLSDYTDAQSNSRYYYRAFATATNAGGTSNSGTYTAGTELGPLTNIVLYTVTFDANGGSSTPSAVTQTTEGGSVTLAAAISRTGYTFGGWNTNSSGTGTNYSASSSYTPSANITLYAKWTANVTIPPTPTISIYGYGSSNNSTASGFTIASSGATSVNWYLYRTATGTGTTGYGTGTYTQVASGSYATSGSVNVFIYLAYANSNGYYYLTASATNSAGTSSISSRFPAAATRNWFYY